MYNRYQRNPRRFAWEENLREAWYAIQAGMPIHCASRMYFIPKYMLYKMRASRHFKKKPPPVMRTAEEEMLVDWVFECSRRGLPVKKPQLLNSVALIVKGTSREKLFTNGRPGQSWFKRFSRRHRNAHDALQKNASIVKTAFNEDGITSWFSNLREYLAEKQLLNIDPTRIFSTETCLLWDSTARNWQQNLTAQFVGNAAGQLLPPMLMYAHSRLQLQNSKKMSKKDLRIRRLMKAENFYEYISEDVLPWLNENEIEFPIVMFVNGQVPNLTLSSTDFCSRNNIELIALPPNCSRQLEPLTVALFPALKKTWNTVFNNHYLEINATDVLRECFAPSLKMVLSSLDTVNILKNGFLLCGLYPLVENTLEDNKTLKETVKKTNTEKIEGSPIITVDEVLFKKEEKENTAEYEKVLQLLEKLMNTKTLKTFRSVNESDEWTGKIENTSLFYMWRKISNFCKTGSSNDSQQNTDEKCQIYEDGQVSDDSMNSNDDVEILFEVISKPV